MQIDRPTIRLTAISLLVAVAAFVVVHDMGTGAILEDHPVSTTHNQNGVSDAHEVLALCALALVLGISLLGIRPSRNSTTRDAQLDTTQRVRGRSRP